MYTHNQCSKLSSIIYVWPLPLSPVVCPLHLKQCTSNWRKSGRISRTLILFISSSFLHLTQIFWTLLKPSIKLRNYSRPTNNILDLSPPQPVSYIFHLKQNILLLNSGQKKLSLPLPLPLLPHLRSSTAVL